MNINILISAAALITIVACQNTNDKNPPMPPAGENTIETKPSIPDTRQNAGEKNPALFGSWQGTEWLLAGKAGGMDATQVHFDFNENGTFKANYGDQHKSGTWRTMKDSLYTTQTGMKELPIKLLKVDASILEFEMNVKGKPEVLKFKKQ